MKTVRDICEYIGSIIDSGPICVETGTTFAITPENLIHTTTNNIFGYIVVPNCGLMYSLDMDEERTKIAASILPPESQASDAIVGCRFMVGDSVESLKKLNNMFKSFDHLKVSVLCLDSSGYPDHIFNEYKAIEESLAIKHFVLVDDIHNSGSIKYKKVVPLLKELGYNYIEVPTPTGMFMAVKGYELPNIGEVF